MRMDAIDRSYVAAERVMQHPVIGTHMGHIQGMADRIADAEAVMNHQTDNIVARDVHTTKLTEALQLEMEERQNWMRIAMEQEAARVRAESERDAALRQAEMETRGRKLAEVGADTERAAMQNARADAEAHADLVAEAQERTKAYAIVTADLIERERVIVDSFRAREEALLASHPCPPVPPCPDPIALADTIMVNGPPPVRHEKPELSGLGAPLKSSRNGVGAVTSEPVSKGFAKRVGLTPDQSLRQLEQDIDKPIQIPAFTREPMEALEAKDSSLTSAVPSCARQSKSPVQITADRESQREEEKASRASDEHLGHSAYRRESGSTAAMTYHSREPRHGTALVDRIASIQESMRATETVPPLVALPPPPLPLAAASPKVEGGVVGTESRPSLAKRDSSAATAHRPAQIHMVQASNPPLGCGSPPPRRTLLVQLSSWHTFCRRTLRPISTDQSPKGMRELGCSSHRSRRPHHRRSHRPQCRRPHHSIQYILSIRGQGCLHPNCTAVSLTFGEKNARDPKTQ